MDVLHLKVAQHFRDRLEDEDDKITAAELAQLVRFLKDNNITALPEAVRFNGLNAELDAAEVDVDAVIYPFPVS